MKKWILLLVCVLGIQAVALADTNEGSDFHHYVFQKS